MRPDFNRWRIRLRPREQGHEDVPGPGAFDFRSRQGQALIIVLWCLLVLGMAVFGVIEIIEVSVNHTAREQLVLEARALASSGVALGLNPQLLKNDPLLSQIPANNRQFQVTISSEGALLNLNYILLSNHREILVNLFTRWGLKLLQADHVADCLYDWVTPGDLPSLNGAKADQYARAHLPQRPTSQPFESFDEVNLVIGMDLIRKIRPQWQDSFTLWSNGPLNVNEAAPELIAAIFGLDSKRVGFLTQARNGKDGIAGTADDAPLNSLSQLQANLSIDPLTMQALSNQISFSDPVRRVKSIGQAEGIQVMISVVTRLNTSPVQYFLWSEQ